MLTTLIVPGLHGSGPEHWQTWMEGLIPDARRVEQEHWDRPDLDRWAERVGERIDDCKGGVLVVAHSFGCLATVRACELRPGRIRGALLVAPADPKKFGVSTRLAQVALPFPGAVVASSNDPWMSSACARYCSLRWGCRFIDVGAAGHINVDSGFGPWPEGYLLYEELSAAVEGVRVPARQPGAAGRALPVEGRRALSRGASFSLV